jgi:hypothetical protein
LIVSVGCIPGALNILIALGFREEEGGALVMPIDANIADLEARKLELDVGLNLIRKRIESGAAATAAAIAEKAAKGKGEVPKGKPGSSGKNAAR